MTAVDRSVEPPTVVPDGTATWEPPGPGSWVRDASHTGPAPTRFFRRVASTHTAPAYARVLEEWGGALATIELRFVHGAMYRRLVPLVAADRDEGRLPPRAVVWLLTRLHPAFRKRTTRARAALTERPYLDVVAGWSTEREHWAERNRHLSAVDPREVTDAALATHLRELDAHLVDGWRRHHELHGADLGPIGDLLVHAREWGLDPTEVMAVLEGSSPATTRASHHATAIADALRSGGIDPAAIGDVDTIRTVAEAGDALDAYLDEFGWRVVTGYDLEDLTLHELPSAVCAIVRATATGATPATGTADTDAEERLRRAAPEPDRFDELLDAARAAYGMRDDNGPLTWEWPVGLLRRAYLAAGDRLATDGRLDRPALVFELDVEEVATALDGGDVPGDVEARAERRAWEAMQTPPATLGPPPDADPDLSAFPEPLARVMAIVIAASTMLEPDPAVERVPLRGLGIGDAPHVGTARVAADPATAIAAMEPGDVLVAPWTAPSYNAVISIAGAIVVQEGGLLCHAAVMARELGLPAVVGCHEAMSRIRTGDRVEVDPVAGGVRVLERLPTD